MHINTDSQKIDTTPSPEQRIVFIDCEFTDLVDPKLLSIGLVSDDGRELNIELTGSSHLVDVATFVLNTVLPQFGLMPHQEITRIDIGKRVGARLLGLGDASITVFYDYHSDMDLLESTLHSAGLWTQLSPILQPTHVGYQQGSHQVSFLN